LAVTIRIVPLLIEYIMKTTKEAVHPVLAMEVLQQFRLIYGSMRQYFRLVEERCGMPGSQMWVLQEVQRSPEIGISELAVRTGVHQSTASLLVDKLVGQGYVSKSRQSADLRRVGLCLTGRGQEALAALPGPAEGILPAALAELPEVVLKTLHINLDELIRHLPGKDDSCTGTPLAEIIEGGVLPND
jgi:MarR family transcriptional regulator, organic hydroperoxide resistance regulator